jgi:cell division protein FtsN
MPVGVRSRGRSGPGRAAWIIFAGAAFAILAVTFALGALVGREWGRQTPRATAAASVQRSATSPRRSRLADVSAERTRAPQEKLTFYQTLTAPLGAAPASSKAASLPLPKPPPAATSRSSGPPAADSAARPSERATETVLPPRPAPDAQGVDRPAAIGEPRHDGKQEVSAEHLGAPRAAGEQRREASSEWTVQIGVFTTSERAERVRKELVVAGFHPRVTPAVGEDGQPRFRVRLGEFKTKEEALRTAERVRADRSLPTFVTAK